MGSGSGFDGHFDARFRQVLNHVGHEGDTLLTGSNLRRYSDTHNHENRGGFVGRDYTLNVSVG